MIVLQLFALVAVFLIAMLVKSEAKIQIEKQVNKNREK